LGPYTRRSIRLSLFNPGPNQLPDWQEPTTTAGSSNGRVAFRRPESTLPFCDPWQDRCQSGPRHPPTLSTPFSEIGCSQRSTGYPVAGGCTRLLDLVPLPPCCYPSDSSRPLLGVGRWSTHLSSTDCRHIPMRPCRERTLA